jgi:hypothetical protein
MNSIDSSNQRYTNIETVSGHVRVTRVEQGWAGEPCIRIQIQDDANHLRFGPDIPLSCLSKVLEAMMALALATETSSEPLPD